MIARFNLNGIGLNSRLPSTALTILRHSVSVATGGDWRETRDGGAPLALCFSTLNDRYGIRRPTAG